MKKIFLGGLLLVCLPAAGVAGEHYFVVVFGSNQRPLKDPRHAHSWAVFVRLCGAGCDLSKYEMEYVTVSWLPCTLEVRLHAARSEPGTNVELHDTIHWALASRQVISYWGPYEILPELYWTAYRGAARLNSGAVRYKAIDSFRSTSRVTNCIHAASELAEGEGRLRIGTPGWGDTASYFITLKYEDWIVDWTTHDWIIDCLGLRGYPMWQRDIDRGNPTVRPLLRLYQSVTQWRP